MQNAAVQRQHAKSGAESAYSAARATDGLTAQAYTTKATAMVAFSIMRMRYRASAIES